MPELSRRFLMLNITLLALSCGEGSIVDMSTGADGAGDQALSSGKADGDYSACELTQILLFVNAPTTTFETLMNAGVHRRAAENIAAHKRGPDGEAGTTDDRLFDSVEAIDAVPYVGPAAFRQLAEHAVGACVEPAVEAIFSPQLYENSHLQRVVEWVDSTTHTIDIAMYSFHDASILAALERAVQRGVVVRMVFESAKKHRTDPEGTLSAQLEDIGVDVRWVNKIMHHKFALFDGPRDAPHSTEGTLLTGSANWSHSAGTRYDENTIVLRAHAEGLLRYQREFNLLWNYSRPFDWNLSLEWFATADIPDTSVPDDASFHAVFTSANFELTETSYGPTFRIIRGRNTVSDYLVSLIEGATQSIHVASGHLRSRAVSEALLAKQAQYPDMDIRVYLDGQEYCSAWYHNEQVAAMEDCLVEAGSSESQQQKCRDRGFLYGYTLAQAGIDVRFKYYAYRWHYTYAAQMHHKYLIIDGHLLATGSYNLSDNAEHNTLENVAVYDASAFPSLLNDFEENFETIWDTGGGGQYEALVETISTATDGFPIVFDSMALDWDRITELKALIRNRCPLINSVAYRTQPEDHTWCEFP